MTAGHDFEQRLAEDLRRELDPLTGPHPGWIGSPAAARIAARRGGIRWPGRLLAVAAVLAVAGGVALVLAQRHDGVAGCPTLADYAAASAKPSPHLGDAPGVSFPPVAPDASPTVGLLQPGTWAVIADAKGPFAQVRIRGVRDCGRLPDYRSGWVGGSIVLATADVRVLRNDYDLAWLGFPDQFYVGLGGTDPGPDGQHGPSEAFVPFGIPGVDRRGTIYPETGFEATGDVVLDLPPSDLQANVYPATLGVNGDAQAKPLGVGWVLRSGRTGKLSIPQATPGATSTTGELVPGDVATIKVPGGDIVVTVTDIDQVDAYPGRLPGPGHVFLESRIAMVPTPLENGDGTSEWRAVDGEGHELRILVNQNPTQPDRGVLQYLWSVPMADGWFEGFLVVDAPRSGLVRLELRRNGQPEPVLSYVIRQP